MPATSIRRASSLEPRSGAKPPSSPTAVPRPRSCSVRLSAWNTSVPMRRHSEKLCRAARHDHELLEVHLVVGVRATVEHVHHRHRQHPRRLAAEVAPQRAAPPRPPARAPPPAIRRGSRWRPAATCSACRRARSAPRRGRAGRRRPVPATAAAISPLTLATARVTPLPCQRSPPSRSSVASNSPVEAPEGTAAWPCAPERSPTSTSTVGLPRLSRIWRAWTRSIWLIPATPVSAWHA